MSSRIACVAVPDLALQALLRARADLIGVALALVDGVPGSARAVVLAVSPEAAAARVRPGHTTAQARATLPQLRLEPAQPAATEAARAALHDVGLGFAPRVELEAAAVLLEVSDLGRLYPSEGGLATALSESARRVGLAVRVGVAASKGVARLAAWSGRTEIALVPAGKEAAFVGRLPIGALSPSPEVEAACLRWGVRTAGELAALAEREVSLRLGADGARLHQLACGRGGEPLRPRAPTDTLEESVTLDDGIANLEALAFVLRGLIDRLIERLVARHLACAGLLLRLQLSDRSCDVREVPLGAPTREVATLVELVRLSVARRPPACEVVGITLGAEAARVRTAQLDFFRPAGPAPDRLAQAVAKLEALVGDAGTVGAPRPVDSWRDEEIAVTPYRALPASSPAPSEKKKRSGKTTEGFSGRRWGPSGVLVLRRFRPAQPVEVLLDGGQVPRALSGAHLAAQLTVAAGPYRVSGEWWGPTRFARDCWDVHASDGTLYRIHCDAAGHWFVEGYYD